MRGRGWRLPAAAALVVVGALVVVVVVLLTRGGGGGPATGTGGASALPPVPAWGRFPGAPPPLAPPAGGNVAPVADGGPPTLRVTRPDGSTYATVDLGAGGEVTEARFHDRRGRLTVVVSRVAAPPAPARAVASALRRRCVDRRRLSGWYVGPEPFRWRYAIASTPRYLRRASALAAVRAARITWVRALNRCGVPDRSALRFSYLGTTTRGTARDGVSTVGFGEVDALGGTCAGAVACTITWLSGPRAIESDARLDRDPGARYGTGTGRVYDLRGVIVHETGHTIGLGHVDSPDNVMNPYLAPGDRGARVLGLGDVRALNARY